MLDNKYFRWEDGVSFMKKTKKIVAIIGAISFFALSLSACSSGEGSQASDIISQKTRDANKIQISVMVKNAFTINGFEKAVEEKFPNIDIVQIGNYARNIGIKEYERRLKNDDLTDIIMTWPLDVGEEYLEDRLLELSGMPFTSSYHISMLNNISKDGKLYYLPGPAQVRGIVYNKTLFKEKGWEVPANFEEFVTLCKDIEASGIRSIQLGFGNSEVLDTAFVGYSYGDCFSKPQDAEWLKNYNNGTGSIADQLGTALDTFQYMIDQGIWKKSDLDVYYPEREKMLFTRQCAMVEDSVLIARMGLSRTGITDEYALMPFFSPTSDTDWARLYMVCYIGANKHLAEPENKEKYDVVMDILEYISTPDGQEALAADTGAMYSSVNNVAPPNIAEIEKLIPILNGGRYAIFPELKYAQKALREGLAGMLSGTKTKADVIKMVDEQNHPVEDVNDTKVLGTATKDFSLIETGNFVTDVMREKANSDFALFMDNGKDGVSSGMGISGKLYEGEITESDIMCVLPDLRHDEKGVLQIITMTGADLIKALEYTMTIDNDIKGGYYYFSGLKMEYSVTAEPGSRIKKISDLKGNGIEQDKIYTVAIMDGGVSGELIKSTEETGIKIENLLIDAITQKGNISPSEDNRFILAK